MRNLPLKEYGSNYATSFQVQLINYGCPFLADSRSPESGFQRLLLGKRTFTGDKLCNRYDEAINGLLLMNYSEIME